MDDILLCTHNPMLIKGLYGILRDEGYSVELADYPAHAVRKIMQRSYSGVILDSMSFGMPAEDAVWVIRTIAPEVPVILVGHPEQETDSLSIRVPADLEKLRTVVHEMHQTGSISHK